MLSATAEYALRIMIVLAEAPGDPITSEKIAQRTKVPTDYSVKVLQMLARAGLVRAQRGRSGGFHINCDAKTTTLLDVVNAIDPIERIKKCPFENADHDGQLCPLHSRLDEIIALLEDSFRKMTIQSVLDGSPGPALCAPTPAVTAVAPAPGSSQPQPESA